MDWIYAVSDTLDVTLDRSRKGLPVVGLSPKLDHPVYSLADLVKVRICRLHWRHRRSRGCCRTRKGWSVVCMAPGGCRTCSRDRHKMRYVHGAGRVSHPFHCMRRLTLLK